MCLSPSGQRSVTGRLCSAPWSAVVPRAPCWPVPSSSLSTTVHTPTPTTGKSSSRATDSGTTGRWGIWIWLNGTASGWMKAWQREESGQGNSGEEPLHFNKLLILQRGKHDWKINVTISEGRQGKLACCAWQGSTNRQHKIQLLQEWSGEKDGAYLSGGICFLYQGRDSLRHTLALCLCVCVQERPNVLKNLLVGIYIS